MGDAKHSPFRRVSLRFYKKLRQQLSKLMSLEINSLPCFPSQKLIACSISPDRGILNATEVGNESLTQETPTTYSFRNCRHVALLRQARPRFHRNDGANGG